MRVYEFHVDYLIQIGFAEGETLQRYARFGSAASWASGGARRGFRLGVDVSRFVTHHHVNSFTRAYDLVTEFVAIM